MLQEARRSDTLTACQRVNLSRISFWIVIHIMVLSGQTFDSETEPVTIEDADRTRERVAELDGSKRLRLGGRVNPNQDGDLEAMDELAENWNISAFKTYTQYKFGNWLFFA